MQGPQASGTPKFQIPSFRGPRLLVHHYFRSCTHGKPTKVTLQSGRPWSRLFLLTTTLLVADVYKRSSLLNGPVAGVLEAAQRLGDAILNLT